MKQELLHVVIVLTCLVSSRALHLGFEKGKKISIYYTSATRKCTLNSGKTDSSLITQIYDDSASSRLLAPVEFHSSRVRPIRSHQQMHYSTRSLVNLGCAFSLNSGFLNGLCLSGVLGRAMPVAAVTGTYTNAAVASFARHQKQHGIGALVTILATPACFMLGSLVNGLCNPEGTTMGMEPLSMIQTLPLLLAGAMILFAKYAMNHDVLLACLYTTFAMGLQNSWTSTLLPGNLLRTTHFSGITSDFGTILGQTIRGNRANAYKLSTFASLTASFWLGGMLSQVVAGSVGLAPSLCYTMSAFFYFGVWAMLQHSLRRHAVTFHQSIQASLYQRYRTAVAFFNFWWKERLDRNQWSLSWHP